MAGSPEAVVYLYYGQDEPTLKEEFLDFCAGLFESGNADLNTTYLDGRSVALGDIETAAGAFPFLADVRLVVVENITDSAGGRAVVEKLDEMFERLPDWCRVIFLETGLEGGLARSGPNESSRMSSRRPALKNLLKAVEADPRGKVRAFEQPASAAEWVRTRAARYGVSIDAQAAQVLTNRINDDLNLADAELAKLSTYVNQERPVTVEDVEMLTPYSPEANIFEMVDAMGFRQGSEALRLFHQLIMDGDEPLRIFGMIIRQYRLLLQMREQLDKGQTSSSAARAMGIKSSWVADKLAKQARAHSIETYERIYMHLLEVDLSIKTGKADPELAIETLIVRLAARS